MTDTVSQIKQQLDIVDVVSGYISLIKAGRNYKSACPFHADDTPSFMVSSELQMYKCFGCGESGDMFSFIQKIENIDFSSALEILAEKAGVTIDKSHFDAASKVKKQILHLNELAATFYNNVLLKHPAGRDGLDYFEKTRGLTKDTIITFSLGFAPNKGDVLYNYLKQKGHDTDLLIESGLVIKTASGIRDKFIGRVIFPFIDTGGKVVGFSGRTIYNRDPKYLNTSETPVFHKSNFLYGLNNSKLFIKKEGAIFVEGPVDVISAFQAGIKNVVASSGTSLTAGQLTLISRYTKDINFCFDSDNAGSTAMQRAIDLTEKFELNVKAIIIPEEYKDLDDVVRLNKNLAKTLVESSVPVYDFFMVAAFKRHDKSSPHGKKAIVADLTQRFSKITNNVLLDHYAHEVSDALNINYDIVYDAFFNKVPTVDTKAFVKDYASLNTESVISEQFGLDSYIMSLFLKSDIDKIRSYAYKLDVSDFLDIAIRVIFGKLIEYIEIEEHNNFDISSFKNYVPDEYQALINDLYLFEPLDSTLAEQELSELIERIKQNSLKRTLVALGDEIKLAEKEGNLDKLTKLATQFNTLSKNLIKNK